MLIAKAGRHLTTLDLWGEHAGPKHSSQWVPERSAMELARAWLESAENGRMPPEIEATLESHSAFGRPLEWSAEPEVKLPFDAFRGEPRNTDLLVHVRDQYGPFLVAVEGKADEPFAETVEGTIGAALERYVETRGRSNGIRRVEQLAAALFRPWKRGEPTLGQLRYQLLTASAGALCAAPADVTRVVLLVHEFVTPLTTDDNHKRNQADLDLFLARLSQGTAKGVQDRQLVGPFAVPGQPLLKRPLQLFVGKATRRRR